MSSLNVLADFPEFAELTEELLKADFEQFLQIYTILQQKILDFSNQVSTESANSDTLIQVYELLSAKIQLTELYQHDVKAALINLTVSQKIQKKYTAE